MLKKGAVVLLSSAMLLNSLGVASASANEVSTTTNDVKISAEVETVSVRDIVPEAYFEKVKGKYQSKEEILKATGFTVEKTESASTVQLNKGATTVDDLDEYAALLTYYSDIANQSFKASSAPQARAAAAGSNTATVWGDGLAAGANLSWITATVYYDRNSSGNITKVTGSSSSLQGFHPGNSWSHDAVATNNSASFSGKSGSIYIKGTRTLSIITGGIGDIVSKPQSFFMGLG